MQIDSSVLISLLLNIGLILAFSWLGVKLFNSYCFRAIINNGQATHLATKIVSESAVIVPRLRRLLRVRRMIKSNSDNDDTPFFRPQFS
ncbi:hypothetical protein Tfer_3257 [Thermincola ferriacetica]|uniref:Uncharacterized protein n=1 Tax=Thermincola ferriacetica TaxID=281456 RepID=A0A0L6VZD0_9FIRM|nr:hypothetical protein [Thermincola ferriacetica]KNZ68204.1 hypothetical protein Tfer_3257 [Thermincola ferriacetica]